VQWHSQRERSLTITSLQIYFWIYQWKHFKNRLKDESVIAMNLICSFFMGTRWYTQNMHVLCDSLTVALFRAALLCFLFLLIFQVRIHILYALLYIGTCCMQLTEIMHYTDNQLQTIILGLLHSKCGVVSMFQSLTSWCSLHMLHLTGFCYVLTTFHSWCFTCAKHGCTVPLQPSSITVPNFVNVHFEVFGVNQNTGYAHKCRHMLTDSITEVICCEVHLRLRIYDLLCSCYCIYLVWQCHRFV